ncbi:MBL fold metallo-hydrolase [Hydrogenimonas urashimensis]|uniref:MBL fold metallo-hydrolase n=1 Tax=Hydrogenimonas urashimensis TaxID=2740515 RepID=UPI001915C124|nr:MBL fold metallo-hydrolase [Hydrogenimonas urashimensis]
MQIQMQPMGAYQTNCYIVTIDGRDLIVDPGVGATEWVMKHVKNPIAILNTHGHFDHVWSNAELKKRLGVPICCPEGDTFMLEKDPFSQGTPPSRADVAVKPDETLQLSGVTMTFLHFPGHTPGTSAIEIEGNWFCGDFLFKGSIGRVDFPYSDPVAMVKSLKRALEWPKNAILHPGHGPRTTLEAEKKVIPYWIEALG